MTPTTIQVAFSVLPEYYTPSCLRVLPIDSGTMYLQIDLETGQIDNFWSSKPFDIAQPIESADFYLFQDDELLAELIGGDLTDIIQCLKMNDQGETIISIDQDGIIRGWSRSAVNFDELGV